MFICGLGDMLEPASPVQEMALRFEPKWQRRKLRLLLVLCSFFVRTVSPG